MRPDLIAGLALTVLAASAGLTLVVRRLALTHGILDVPNERSSHTMATPRGGGVAVVVTMTLSLILLGLLRVIEQRLVLAAVGGGVGVALIGYLDDRYRLPAKLRVLVHFAAAGVTVAVMGGAPALQIGHKVFQLGWIGDVLATTGIVWMLNLFNFMDGIDGIAASEAVFVACCGSVLAWVGGSNLDVSIAGLVFGASCLGFLIWNWPPAKIFMGDVGSGYIGFIIGLLMLAATRADPSAFWIWVILAGTFVVDATVTLLRRTIRGERVYQAHRSHAYQWLARRWGSHKRVTISVALVNVLWLLPCAILASGNQVAAAWVTLVALAPLTLMALVAGSGVSEHPR